MKPSKNKNKFTHITVQHDYHDHSTETSYNYLSQPHPARGGVTTPFPLKLHEMLETCAQEGNDHIVSWQPHGRCFIVRKPKEFVALILPNYFKLSKLASFQRQLNLYGFQRLTCGKDRGGYYHELFLQGKVFMAHSIQRIKVKGTGVRARSNPAQEPDLWTMEWVNNTASNNDTSSPCDENHTTPPVSSPCSPSSYPQQEQAQQQQDSSSLVLDFGDKTFHYLDPFLETDKQEQPWSVQGIDQLLANEAESFFQDFEFPQYHITTAEIENDLVFGDLLKQMIA
jgi:hypothetical protein